MILKEFVKALKTLEITWQTTKNYLMCKDCSLCENLFSLDAEKRKRAETSNDFCSCKKTDCPFWEVSI